MSDDQWLNAEPLLTEATAAARLTVPTLALGADSVGDALHRQLRPIAKNVVGHVIPDCGHIVPLDGPEALLELVTPFPA
ncbi:alpha/beta fold hydrolase [Nocardia sp. MDA0666]|uniref:alpha/beta fold hydrolase n=1 Tax=Nocardia sp. MDA0666 TaxID=2135448 RepID=UPI0018EC031A|nr:alpha/beta hydrolase [Nocardia sp. MDA0666]